MEKGIPVEIFKVGNGYIVRAVGNLHTNEVREISEAFVFSFLGRDDWDYESTPTLLEFLREHFEVKPGG